MTAHFQPRVLLIFVDGVGLAPAGPDNPLSTSSMPATARLLGGPLTSETLEARRSLGDGESDGAVSWTLAALDANLGVDGLPQSATGQTTLFTGRNAATAMGRHVPSFPGGRLRELIDEAGLLAAVDRLGLASTFANAFSPVYFQLLEQRKRRKSVTFCLVEAAGHEPRGLDELRSGRAVSWDVTREMFAVHAGGEIPIETIPATQAGEHLVSLTRPHELVIYETFLTDLAGHDRLEGGASQALSAIDGLLEGVLVAGMDDFERDLTMLVTSDHGNIEELDHRRHTRNPVPLLAVGRHARRFADLTSLDQVTPAILDLLREKPEG